MYTQTHTHTRVHAGNINSGGTEDWVKKAQLILNRTEPVNCSAGD